MLQEAELHKGEDEILGKVSSCHDRLALGGQYWLLQSSLKLRGNYGQTRDIQIC